MYTDNPHTGRDFAIECFEQEVVEFNLHKMKLDSLSSLMAQ